MIKEPVLENEKPEFKPAVRLEIDLVSHPAHGGGIGLCEVWPQMHKFEINLNFVWSPVKNCLQFITKIDLVTKNMQLHSVLD